MSTDTAGRTVPAWLRPPPGGSSLAVLEWLHAQVLAAGGRARADALLDLLEDTFRTALEGADDDRRG
jgi:hypothetical protein